ncbi:MAG: single-stranded DNA-binding protein [Acidithiobacillus sp.]|jgi:single-strand DNA-binding protein|nr:single-stranded DNA-binding protein [Acidithiobacillus sp.]
MYQRIEIMGRIGKIETRYTKDGDPVVNMSVATSESYKDKNGEKKEITEWHNVVIFKKLAEVANEYCQKGQLVFLAGKLRTRKWADKDGNDRYTTEMVANELKMLSKKEGGAASHEDQPADQSHEDFDSEIPF